MVHIGIYNPHQQKFFGSSVFKVGGVAPKTEGLRVASAVAKMAASEAKMLWLKPCCSTAMEKKLR